MLESATEEARGMLVKRGLAKLEEQASEASELSKLVLDSAAQVHMELLGKETPVERRRRPRHCAVQQPCHRYE